MDVGCGYGDRLSHSPLLPFSPFSSPLSRLCDVWQASERARQEVTSAECLPLTLVLFFSSCPCPYCHPFWETDFPSDTRPLWAAPSLVRLILFLFFAAPWRLLAHATLSSNANKIATSLFASLLLILQFHSRQVPSAPPDTSHGCVGCQSRSRTPNSFLT